jgi:hypothetical protein
VLYSDQALVAIRDSMATGGLIVGVTAVVLNILFPPQTARVTSKRRGRSKPRTGAPNC